MLVNNTPVEAHMLNGVPIHVKREDLCAPLPGPMFSKMRGVVAHIKARDEPVIGVLDTLHSKAGWCVSYVCEQLGKKAVNYWPRYNGDPAGIELPREQQQRAQALGARMVAIKAGRSAILYHTAKKHLREQYGETAYLMPNALKLQESITENAAEAWRTSTAIAAGTSSPILPERAAIVISISSGTVAAGVLKGLKEAWEEPQACIPRESSQTFFDAYKVFLHMGYSRSIDASRAYMEKMSGLTLPPERVVFVDESFGYADRISVEDHSLIPFPCNPHYDGKAWNWLAKHGVAQELHETHGGIVFWNIGA